MLDEELLEENSNDRESVHDMIGPVRDDLVKMARIDELAIDEIETPEGDAYELEKSGKIER